LKENGSVVIIVNFNHEIERIKLNALIEETQLSIMNSFEVVRESLGKLGRPKNKKNIILVLSKY